MAEYTTTRTLMVQTTCICGESDNDFLGEKDQRQVGRCTNCGLIRTLQRAEDYAKLYTEGLRYHEDRTGHTAYRDRFEHDLRVANSRHEKLADVLGRRTLLDVGCANGAFVAQANMLGFDAYGIEPNPFMADWATDATGCPVFTGWSEVPPRLYFDVVTFHDVLEHIPDPRAELQRVSMYMKAGALLVIDVPDAGDEKFAADPMGSHHMKPVEHLYFYDGESLTSLVESQGFSVVKVDRPILGKLVVYARKA